MTIDDASNQKRDSVPHWVDIISALTAVISTTIGGQAPNFDWLLYLSGIALGVLILSILARTTVGSELRHRVQRAIDRLRISRFEKRHRQMIGRLRCACDLQQALTKISWSARKPDGLQILTNTHLQVTSQTRGLPRFARVIATNLAYSEVLRIFDSALHTLSNDLKSGAAYYEKEDDMSEVLEAHREYLDATKEYNRDLERINDKLRTVRLLNIHPHTRTLWRNNAVATPTETSE